MEKDWVVIYTTDKPYQAEIAKKVLEGGGIESVVIDKKDSSYTTFGEAELYVNQKDEAKAIELVKDIEP
jgi:hypothetical protein